LFEQANKIEKKTVSKIKLQIKSQLTFGFVAYLALPFSSFYLFI
jgi:hypothetical protein